MIIKKPLLAGKFDPEQPKYPYLATPKIDGIRFIMVNGVALSRSFKPIRNNHVQSLLQKNLPMELTENSRLVITFKIQPLPL